ncbi:MAG: NADPH-dependent F420 reductase [Bacteroidota bacterium]
MPKRPALLSKCCRSAELACNLLNLFAMRIAVIGTGNVGQQLARAFSSVGHEVVFGTRDPHSETSQALAETMDAGMASPREAAQSADLVALAVPGQAVLDTAQTLGDLSGTIVIDPTNPVGPGLLPPASGDERSQAERLADLLPGARVVKAFNTLAAEHMTQGHLGGRPIALFVCGDDAEAKTVLMGMASDLGFEPVDVGGLDRARLTEPLALVWITLAVRGGYGRNFAFSLTRG